MLMSLRNARTEWNDYFPGTVPTKTFVPKEYTTAQSTSDQRVYVLNCLFNECTSTNEGGALYCSASVTYLLVESSSFFSCSTSSNGGAIYFYNTGSGQYALHMVCGNDCHTTRSGSYQFAHTISYNAASIKNYVNYSSIVRCVNENSNSEYVFMIQNGKVFFPSVNISMNKCEYRSIYCYSFTDPNYVTGSFSYSSFADNNVTSSCFIYFASGGTKYEIKCSNILRNAHDSSSGGIIGAYGYLMIEDSCILENKANYIFYVYHSSYTITLSNCTVDSTSNNGYLKTQNTVTKSFIQALNHMSTQNCYSEFGDLAVVTSKEKKVYCYTGNDHCQAGISDFFLFIFVFGVTFIHTKG
jgi:hypothetical protein